MTLKPGDKVKITNLTPYNSSPKSPSVTETMESMFKRNPDKVYIVTKVEHHSDPSFNTWVYLDEPAGYVWDVRWIAPLEDAARIKAVKDEAAAIMLDAKRFRFMVAGATIEEERSAENLVTELDEAMAKFEKSGCATVEEWVKAGRDT
jgi:hypothetical protein